MPAGTTSAAKPFPPPTRFRRFNPNIQTVHAMLRGTRKRMNVCTSCIKAGKITR